MKKVILSFCLITVLHAAAQNKQYYDHNWKPSDANYARFVSLTEKSDSGWVRRDFYLSTKKSQMRGLYKDSSMQIKNGWFRYFYVNQVLKAQGNYVNGKKEGLWVSYYYNGSLKDSAVYHAGYPEMIKGWHSNGNIYDSSVYNNDGSAVHTYWFDNGVLSHAGSSYKGYKEGEWKYFHKNGKPAAVEEYKHDQLISRIYYDETGRQMADTTNRDRPAAFKGGEKKWRSFLLKNMDFLDDVKLKNTFFVTVVLELTIDESGNITDAYVDVPVSARFDEEALKVIKKSPAWIPATDHNRRIKSYKRQVFTFGQVD